VTAPSGSASPPLTAFTEEQRRENERCLDELVELIASRQALAFVGAGSSIPLGFRTWEGLLDELASHAASLGTGFVEQKPNDAGEYLDYASRIKEHILHCSGPKGYGEIIQKLFMRNRATIGLTDFHRDLVNLPFRAILTTNYDAVLETALGEQFPEGDEPHPVPIWNGDTTLVSPAIRSIAIGTPIQHVIHVHGYFGIVNSIVLSREDYEQAYGTHLDLPPASPMGEADRSPAANLPNFERLFLLMVALMATRRLVFIGFGWQDEVLRGILERVSSALLEWHGAVHFTVSPISSSSPELARARASKLKQTLGIETVFYEEVTDGDHSQRDELIHTLRERVEARLAPSKARSLASQVASHPAVSTTPATWVKANNARQRRRIENK